MHKEECSIHQLQANRSNAEKSTGPRTEEGKQASSRNATRHALAGHQFNLMYNESEAEYQQVLDDLIAEHQPATTTEDILVVKLAQAYWLSQRANRIASADMNDLKQVALMIRYQTMHDRAFQSSLKQLRDCQKLRHAEEHNQRLVAAALKEVELEIKTVRLDTLKAKRNALVRQIDHFEFHKHMDQQIDSLTQGLRHEFEDDDRNTDLAA